MKTGLQISLFLLGGVVACAPACAEPAECNAVLRDGTFKYTNYKRNSQFLQILYSRFLESTYETSKTDTGLSVGVPLGEAVMGSGSYSRDEYEAMKKVIERTNLNVVRRSEEVQVAISSGDAEILGAWTRCIETHGGGFSARFEPLTPTQVRLVLEYRHQGTRNSVKLDQPVTLPAGVDPRGVSNASCLKRGTKITEGKPCRTTISLKDAWMPLSLDISADEASASAFVGPRVKPVEERQNVRFADRLYREFFRLGLVAVASSVELTDEEQKAGWVYDPKSVSASVRIVFNNGSMNWCGNVSKTLSPAKFIYGYQSMSHLHGHSGWTIGCQMDLALERMRMVWVPDETAHPPAPPLNYIPAPALPSGVKRIAG